MNSLQLYTFVLLSVFQKCCIASNCSEVYQECSWSSCFSNANETQTIGNVCTEETGGEAIRQECQNEYGVKGFKFLRCLSLGNRRAVKQQTTSVSAESSPGSNGTIWWPNDKGLWTRASLNCPFAPSIEQYMRNELVRFFLYTKDNDNITDYKEIMVDDVESLKSSGFILNAPLKMITHGFLSSVFTGPSQVLRKYYLRYNATVNIIATEWRILASITNFRIPCYNLAAELTRFVGKRAALLLKFILEQKVTQLKDIHVMGHSLGGHTSGFLGKKFFELTNTKISRITGFDPAGPSFRNKGPEDRIDRSDADFVDIIHTAISDVDFIPGFGPSLELGLDEPVGHVDFYPNGGGRQPGCRFIGFFPVSNPACSHGRSYEYYAESIALPSAEVFRGTLCKGLSEATKGNCEGPETSLMGACTNLTSSNSDSILYYLKTHDASPFALDERKLEDYKVCPMP